MKWSKRKAKIYALRSIAAFVTATQEGDLYAGIPEGSHEKDNYESVIRAIGEIADSLDKRANRLAEYGD